MADIQVVQVSEGRPVEFRGQRGTKRTVKVGRIWLVLYDGEVIGAILYSLHTREQRTPGRTYVNRRWQSPGWSMVKGEKAKNATEHSTMFRGEAYTKKDAIERIVNDHERENGLGFWRNKNHG